jgi:hypothetical protein
VPSRGSAAVSIYRRAEKNTVLRMGNRKRKPRYAQHRVQHEAGPFVTADLCPANTGLIDEVVHLVAFLD